MFNKYLNKLKVFLKRKNSFDILHNRITLYLILFISIINLICAGLMGDYLFITFFILIGIITTSFSKNMVVILIISLVASNVVKCITSGHYEGMENETEVDKGIKEKKNEVVESNKVDSEGTGKYSDVRSKKEIEGMQESYKELMSLQDVIIGKMGSLEESLTSAENVVQNIVKSM